MPLSSRRSRRLGIDIWPGFVDALSQLVMVIVFVLLVFTAGQFYLTDALSGRDAALQRLTQQINQLGDLLSMARNSNTDLQTQLMEISRQLQASKAETDKTKAALAGEQQHGALLQTALQGSQQQLQTSQQQLQAAQLKSSQEQTTIDTLNEQVAALRLQLGQIAAALELSQTKTKQQEAQIADLGQKLNQALLSKVQELAKYRSEFFGRLRDALGDRPDIHIVGDRFVFQSEVLFDPADAQLSPAAKKRLAIVANALGQIAKEIPADIPWVLRVDGHTDKRPIDTAQFPSNWELSSARAISVVNFLISQGIPPDRLVAAGFGQYDPVDPADTPDAYRKNRRIELKLTER
jgi:chemotaxis protein MotB